MSRCPPICIFTHSDYHEVFLILGLYTKCKYKNIVFTNL